MQTGLQKREYRGFSPFDNSATSRLMRMGLLGTNGAANVDAVSVVAKVYSGLGRKRVEYRNRVQMTEYR